MLCVLLVGVCCLVLVCYVLPVCLSFYVRCCVALSVVWYLLFAACVRCVVVSCLSLVFDVCYVSIVVSYVLFAVCPLSLSVVCRLMSVVV